MNHYRVLHTLLKFPDVCNNLIETKCESLSKVLQFIHHREGFPSIATQAHIIATGLCRLASYQIFTNYFGTMEYIFEYMKKHPVFKSHDEKIEFKNGMEDHIADTEFNAMFNMKGNDKRREVAENLKELLMYIGISEIKAKTISANYFLKLVDAIQIAKYILIFQNEKGKPIIKSLTVEQGFDIDVENLL